MSTSSHPSNVNGAWAPKMIQDSSSSVMCSIPGSVLEASRISLAARSAPAKGSFPSPGNVFVIPAIFPLPATVLATKPISPAWNIQPLSSFLLSLMSCPSCLFLSIFSFCSKSLTCVLFLPMMTRVSRTIDNSPGRLSYKVQKGLHRAFWPWYHFKQNTGTCIFSRFWEIV